MVAGRRRCVWLRAQRAVEAVDADDLHLVVGVGLRTNDRVADDVRGLQTGDVCGIGNGELGERAVGADQDVHPVMRVAVGHLGHEGQQAGTEHPGHRPGREPVVRGEGTSVEFLQTDLHAVEVGGRQVLDVGHLDVHQGVDRRPLLDEEHLAGDAHGLLVAQRVAAERQSDASAHQMSIDARLDLASTEFGDVIGRGAGLLAMSHEPKANLSSVHENLHVSGRSFIQYFR